MVALNLTQLDSQLETGSNLAHLNVIYIELILAGLRPYSEIIRNLNFSEIRSESSHSDSIYKLDFYTKK